MNGAAKPRVRSMSMNIFLGGWGGTDGNWGSVFSDYLIYLKQPELPGARSGQGLCLSRHARGQH